MGKTFEGDLAVKNKKFCIIVARFNDFITAKLHDGAVDALIRTGTIEQDIDIVKVPGAFEIPIAAKKVANSGNYNAIICLGAVIRGATPHFDYVCSEVSKGVAQVGLDAGIPVIFGVLTTDTIEQAIERAGTKAGNKGWQSALNAVEMVNLLDNL